MNIDPRLEPIIAAQPYPMFFATISGAHLYGFPRRIRIMICVGRMSCRSSGWLGWS